MVSNILKFGIPVAALVIWASVFTVDERQLTANSGHSHCVLVDHAIFHDSIDVCWISKK